MAYIYICFRWSCYFAICAACIRPDESGQGKRIRAPPATVPPPPPRRIGAHATAALQQVGQPRINRVPTVASPHRSNTAATQLGWNPPQAYTQQHSANNKVVHDMVQVSNANTHAMATAMAASFAEVATTTNAQAMHAVHTMHLAHAASSGNLINQLVQSTRQAMHQMKNVVSSVIQVQHAQPMHAPTRHAVQIFVPNHTHQTDAQSQSK